MRTVTGRFRNPWRDKMGGHWDAMVRGAPHDPLIYVTWELAFMSVLCLHLI